MSGGFGHRNWIATIATATGDWPQRLEFDGLSDRAFAEQLRPVRLKGPMSSGDIALISVVRNEALRLPLFFEHYKKLGVTRFLMVDNASQDATAEVLLAEPLADIFHTDASYNDACSGIYWYNGLARAYCTGHWMLMADADELLVYDGMDERSLADLANWLERNDQDRIFAPMIDVYPSGIIGETGLSAGESLERDSWFDTTGYVLQRHACGWLATGGPRERLFERGGWMSKYPFFRMSAASSLISPHFVWPITQGPARPLGALVHLKFLDDFAERSARNESEGEHYNNAEKYRIINRKLADQPRQTAFYSKSRRYSGVGSLIVAKLVLPIHWDATDKLPNIRTLGAIDYRKWTGGGVTTLSRNDREEFEDFSRRAFDEHLKPIRNRGCLAQGEIGLICVLRNEAARLPLFFAHYKRMGIDRFFMIDNNSQDDSRDLVLAEPSADLFSAEVLFSEGQGGLYWAQSVARHYCEGNWLFRADADELFVYDQMENHDLHAFADWLDRHRMDRVFAPMIDIYPSTAIGRSAQSIEELIENDSWFDNDGYSLEKWPQGWGLLGGPRHRLFFRDGSHRSLMWKYPFFRMRPKTLIYNHHWLWPHDKVTKGALGAMVHLKFMHDLIERSQRYEREGQHWKNSNAYRIINKHMKENPEVVAFYEGSKRYRGPRSLLRHGMLMPIDWENGSRDQMKWDTA